MLQNQKLRCQCYIWIQKFQPMSIRITCQMNRERLRIGVKGVLLSLKWSIWIHCNIDFSLCKSWKLLSFWRGRFKICHKIHKDGFNWSVIILLYLNLLNHFPLQYNLFRSLWIAWNKMYFLMAFDIFCNCIQFFQIIKNSMCYNDIQYSCIPFSKEKSITEKQIFFNNLI